MFIFGENYEVVFEQYIGNALVNAQKVQLPQQFIISQFMQLVQWATQSKEPRKIKMARYENIWDKFDKKYKPVEYSIEFKNWEGE